MEKTRKTLMTRACVAGVLYNLYVYCVGDRFIDAPLQILPILYLPVAVISFALGLALPQVCASRPIKPWLVFLGSTWVVNCIFLTMLIDPVCLHPPGFVSGACAINPAEISRIQAQTIIYMILGPTLIAACCSAIGMTIRAHENIPNTQRVSSGVRVFCWITGPLIMLFGLGGIIDQDISYKESHLTGVPAILAGAFFLFLGYCVFDFACHFAISSRLRTAWAKLTRRGS